MALNTKGILSNVKAQSQKIYRSVKGNLIEDGLLSNSVDNAINKVYAGAEDVYKDTINGIESIKDMEVPNKPKELFEEIIGDEKYGSKDGSIFGISKQMSETQAEKVKEAAAMKMVKKNNGIPSKDNMSTYDGVLKATKGAVAGNTATEMGKQYFIQPVKDLTNAVKAKDQTAAGKALGKVATRAGAVVGGTGAVVGAGSILSSSSDKEIMRY